MHAPAKPHFSAALCPYITQNEVRRNGRLICYEYNLTLNYRLEGVLFSPSYEYQGALGLAWLEDKVVVF